MNDGISREFSNIEYLSVSDAVRQILHFGRYCFLAKMNIQSAFRIIPIHLSDVHLLGFKWRGDYYFDKCLLMECSSSCQIFETFSTPIHWILQKYFKGVGFYIYWAIFLSLLHHMNLVSQPSAIFWDCVEILGSPWPQIKLLDQCKSCLLQASN